MTRMNERLVAHTSHFFSRPNRKGCAHSSRLFRDEWRLGTGLAGGTDSLHAIRSEEVPESGVASFGLAVAPGRAYGAAMATLTQSELGETAVKLLQEAGERPVMIVDGDREVGALVPMEYIRHMKRLAWERMDEISRQASAKVAAHAAELGITPEELVERLLQDDDGE